MPDSELKSQCELLIVLEEIYIRRLLDRDKLSIKIEALKETILSDLKSES